MDSPGHSAQSRRRLHGQYRGGTLSTEEREENERDLERFHKRCKLGGKADRLVRIVDRYMPRIAEENRRGEEADSPANPWPWGPEGRPSDTRRNQGVLIERPAEFLMRICGLKPMQGSVLWLRDPSN